MPQKSIHDGHRGRVKDEFRKMGLGHFPAHKVLELLLFYAIPRGDTNETAHHLLERFGSLQGVLDAPPELLKRTPGIGDEAATYLHLLGRVVPLYLEPPKGGRGAIKDAQQAKEFMRHKFRGEQGECVYLACLGNNGKVIFCEKIAHGSGKRVDIAPAQIVRAALLCSAVKVLIAHNHPDGICNPSREDLHATKLLAEELRRVDIAMFDHIIVAPDGAYSLAEHGLIPRS